MDGLTTVIPAKAGIQTFWKADIVHIQGTLDSRLRGNDWKCQQNLIDLPFGQVVGQLGYMTTSLIFSSKERLFRGLSVIALSTHG